MNLQINFKDPSSIQQLIDLLESAKLSFQDIVNELKKNNTFSQFLKSTEAFQALNDKNLLSNKNLQYLFNEIKTSKELYEFDKNTFLLNQYIENRIITVEELINKHKSNSEMEYLLRNTEIFHHLIKKNLFYKEDCTLLLNKLSGHQNGESLCRNIPLFEYALRNFLIEKKHIDNFEKVQKNQNKGAPKFFEYATNLYEDSEHMTTLLFLYKTLLDKEGKEQDDGYDLLCNVNCTDKERKELFDIIQQKQSLDLKQILISDMIDAYDFETLKNIAINRPKELLKKIVENDLLCLYDVDQLKEMLTNSLNEQYMDEGLLGLSVKGRKTRINL